MFKSRQDAGKQLANLLKHYQEKNDLIVLALPRGGVPVAFEIAKNLKVPMDIFLVRKLGLPENEELAVGAIASNGILILNHEVISQFHVSSQTLVEIMEREDKELRRREKLYRQDIPAKTLKDKITILVDDGLATGASIRAAIAAVKNLLPSRIILAIPVAPKETFASIATEVDESYCLETPSPFLAVGYSYTDFSQTTDKEVQFLLEINETHKCHNQNVLFNLPAQSNPM